MIFNIKTKEIDLLELLRYLFKYAGVIGALLTSYAYFLAYCYEYGIYQGFKIPSTFISVGLEQIIVALISFSLFIILTGYLYWFLILKLASKLSIIKQLKSEWTLLCSCIYLWLIIAFLFEKSSDIRFIYPLIILGVFTGYLGVVYKHFADRRRARRTMQRSNSAVIADEAVSATVEPSHPQTDSYPDWISYSIIIVLAIFVVAVVVPISFRQLGNRSARDKNTYSTFDMSSKFAIMKKSNDVAFVRSFHGNVFTDTLKIINIDNLNNYKLIQMELSFTNDTTRSESERMFDDMFKPLYSSPYK